MGSRVAKTALFDQFARVGKALGSGKRLELLDLLAQGERTVEALARAAELGVTTASAHLQTLKHANLVATRREGTKVYYRLAGTDVAALYALVRTVASAHLPDVEAATAAYLGPGTEQVSREDLLRRARSGDVIALDVRPRDEYAAGHIPGAISVPVEELADALSDIPADQEIVAYCRGAYCVLAHEAVRVLAAHGRRARRLADGMLEWRLAELPVATM
jgi:rhodanese-related sulfurtransferase/DNA-binding transcriptional ArsR family regulator